MKTTLKRRIILICLTLLLVSCFGDSISYNQKKHTFYKYDGMFFFGDKEEDSIVENGSPYEIFNINDISSEYKNIAQEYIDHLTAFINSNFSLFINFNQAMTDFSITEEETNKIYNEMYKKINDELLKILPGAIRCMIGIERVQYIEVAIEIDENVYAITIDPEYVDNVYWMAYLSDHKPPHLKNVDALDDQGVIKYNQWFYESNLKLRVVKQIRDKDGKYYGEIYADYYKLDEYDNLFDKDGNPKHPKEDAK